MQSLTDALRRVIPAKQDQLKRLVSFPYTRVSKNFMDEHSQKSEYGSRVIGDVKVRSAGYSIIDT